MDDAVAAARDVDLTGAVVRDLDITSDRARKAARAALGSVLWGVAERVLHDA